MTAASLNIDTAPNGICTISFSGDWLLDTGLPSTASLVRSLKSEAAPEALTFNTSRLGNWDTGLVVALVDVWQTADRLNIRFDDSGLPDGARQLIRLATAVKEREGARRETTHTPLLAHIGNAALGLIDSTKELLRFVGSVVLSLGRFARGKATYLRSDLIKYIQEAGAEAFPIVGLISFLIGMIFAFVGVVQLNNFGAGIYTANLVAVAMVREMAAIMTAIVLAGRTGAAYAAEIGTMKVNEEVDALTTLGMNPIDFLVTPRVLALIAMVPLLTVYASLMGIIGGALVGVAMLDVSLVQYAAQTADAVGLNSLFGGLFKSIVFGSLVGFAGCQQGMACGNSAMAVGQCTTKAVVMGIVLIVISAAVLTVVYVNLGI